MRRKSWALLVVALVGSASAIGILYWYFGWRVSPDLGSPRDDDLATAPRVAIVAQDLEIPWDLEFLPDGGFFFTERPGRLRYLSPNWSLRTRPVLTVAEVVHEGEGGLLGVEIHPDYPGVPWVYLYFTFRNGTRLENQVVRYEVDVVTLNVTSSPRQILGGIPGASIHDGGRLKFGPDEYLYVTTGDAANAAWAQDPDLLAGKILRVDENGTVPADNPFPGSPVYSYGHRNPQGLAWDGEGRLWATEHGSTATDELNLVEPGNNYGWPTIRGEETAPGMEPPVLQSGTATTWAPSGLCYCRGSLFFTGLRSETLWEATPTLTGDGFSASLQAHLDGEFGRLRAVAEGPDGFLYLLTSNRDGRTIPGQGDDFIYRVNPTKI